MFTSLTNLFYPPVCAGCDALLLPAETAICSRCRHEMPQTQHHLNPQNEAMLKFYGKIPVEFAAAFLHYHKRGVVQQMIHSLKYHGIEAVGKTIGKWYASDLQQIDLLNDVDQIIPVPLHPRKFRQRGYNQITHFSEALSKKLAVPVNHRLLKRVRYSKTQTRKNLMGRSELRDKAIFAVDYDERDHGKHFLLTDDVLTTGATLESCGRVLLGIPGAKISIICMAMSQS